MQLKLHIMKNSIIFFLLVCFITNTYSQIDSNIISKNEFYGTTLNGLSIDKLMKSDGNLNTLKNYFGEPSESNINEKIGLKAYVFRGLRVNFREGLSGFTVLNNEVIINLKGKSFKIGSHINALGHNIIFNTTSSGDKTIILQFCEGCNDYILIDFDQQTKLIKEVRYVILT